MSPSRAETEFDEGPKPASPSDSTMPIDRPGSSRVEPKDFPSENISESISESISEAKTNVTARLPSQAARPKPSRRQKRTGLPILEDRYQVANIIGYGSYGMVFRGKDLLTGSSVAIKILKSNSYGDEFIENQWTREQRLITRLDIDGAPRGLAAGDEEIQDSRVSYLVTELVEGQNLKDWRLGLEEPPSAMEVFDLSRKIIVAMAQIKDLGVIHRDIKPGNIMRTDAGTIKIMDFGLHRLANDPIPKKRARKTLGTPQYMPPELISGYPGSHASDIYSLAYSLYFLILGLPAFPAKTVTEVLKRHRREPMPSLGGRWADTEFEDLLFEMSAKDPEDRPEVEILLDRFDDPDDPLHDILED